MAGPTRLELATSGVTELLRLLQTKGLAALRGREPRTETYRDVFRRPQATPAQVQQMVESMSADRGRPAQQVQCLQCGRNTQKGSAPHSAFARLIVRIRFRTSGGTRGRPFLRRLFHVQKRLNPCRCHRMTVSGFTIMRAVSPTRPDLLRGSTRTGGRCPSKTGVASSAEERQSADGAQDSQA